MLTFRNLNIIALLVVMVLLFLGAKWWAFLLVLFVHGAISYWGTTQISSQFHMPTYYQSQNHKKKEIAISFDDSVINAIQTNQILNILAKYNAKATFFCIGKHLEKEAQKQTLLRMHQEGHLIGNHSYSHSNWFDFFSAQKVAKELEQVDNLIFDIIQKKPLFFRPPYGITTPNIAKAIQQTKHHTIGWSVRSLDTVIKNEQKLLARVSKKLGNGDIVLFHDHLEHMNSFLPLFLEYVLNEGYTIIGIDELLGLKAYQN